VNTPLYARLVLNATCDQFTFLDFVMKAITDNYLKAGDIFVVDNASLHYAAASKDILRSVLDLVGVMLIFLPTYSPELQPVEIANAFVKAFLHRHSDSYDMAVEVARALATITVDNVIAWYERCRRGWERL